MPDSFDIAERRITFDVTDSAGEHKAIVKQIVTAYEGTIEVVSEVRKGTTTLIRLPLE